MGISLLEEVKPTEKTNIVFHADILMVQNLQRSFFGELGSSTSYFSKTFLTSSIKASIESFLLSIEIEMRKLSSLLC